MRGFMKWMLVVLLVILYVISPVDLCPGPVDDLIVILIGIASCRRVPQRED